jgi:uncharacterized cupredoxin-like copper-binding protein
VGVRIPPRAPPVVACSLEWSDAAFGLLKWGAVRPDVPTDVDDPGDLIAHPRRRRAPRWLPAVGAALVLLSACSGGSPAASGSTVNVSLHDFKIESSTGVSSNANVVFRVQNRAPVTHEFVIVRSDLPSDQLPIASDGLSVDEQKLRPVGEIGEVDSGTTQTLALHLAPGRYVYFCNLEGHYLGGMHGVLEVSGDASGF